MKLLILILISILIYSILYQCYNCNIEPFFASQSDIDAATLKENDKKRDKIIKDALKEQAAIEKQQKEQVESDAKIVANASKIEADNATNIYNEKAAVLAAKKNNTENAINKITNESRASADAIRNATNKLIEEAIAKAKN